MPVARYFLFVGAALLALLFVVGTELPPPPTVQATNTAAELPLIRIHTDRKWPERVVFDTSVQPATIAAPTQTASLAPAIPHIVDVSAKVKDAFAQLTPADLKKPAAKPTQKRKVAKKHVSPPTMVVAQRPQFGLFANNIW